MRRSFPILLLALAAASVPTAGAQDRAIVPEGTWYLHNTRATYSGPPIPVRAMLTKIMEKRVVFQPLCTQTQCTSRVTIFRPPRGAPARFMLNQHLGSYTGKTTLTSTLRCNGRPLKATLRLTVKVAERFDDQVLVGSSEAIAVNPGGCRLFGGKARGIRRAWFHGAR